MKIKLNRSKVLDGNTAKAPSASQLDYGELAINYSAADPSIFIKDSIDNVIKITNLGNFIKVNDEGVEQEIIGGGGLNVAGGITSQFGTSNTQLGNIAPLNDWSVYPARS